MTAPAVIMVAPNGARRQQSDHPAVPVTISELAETASACHLAGAQAIHCHVRDKAGAHSLDAGLYREAIAEIKHRTSNAMAIQITTEAVGKYQPAEQIAVVKAVKPDLASVALRELCSSSEDMEQAVAFYRWARSAQIGIQHILYDPDDVERLARLVNAGAIPGERHSILFVLGRYSAGLESDPRDLLAFLATLQRSGLSEQCDWMVCAFGRGETAALAAALALGGHARVGFENSLLEPDGSVAEDNVAQVARITGLARAVGRPSAELHETMRFLGHA